MHLGFSLCSVVAAQASSSNGNFGEWNAFPGGQMPASAQAADSGAADLFANMMTAASPPAAAAPPTSADLFDLMGPSQSLTSSQSLNLSMSSSQTMSTTVLPQSRSQVCMTALIHCSHPSLIMHCYTYHYKTHEGALK